MLHMEPHATSAAEHQDAALACRRWCLLGRASDISLVQQQHVSVCPRNVFFLRLIRVKTAEEQGLTIYPDQDTPTYPILAGSVVLVMQAMPSTKLLEHHKTTPELSEFNTVETVLLADLLQQATTPLAIDNPQLLASKAGVVVDSTPGIYNHDNRQLSCISRSAQILLPLSSRSFRHGGAQHGNSNAPLILSGRSAGESVSVRRLERLGSQTAARGRKLQASLFNCCSGLDND